MLSILIPIYNYNCTALVTELHRQSEAASLEFEIICLDDGSTEEFRSSNKELQNLSQVHYEELGENIGRARIRNMLADKARHKTLLFIDCDMAVSTDNFVERYMKEINGAGVIAGGLAYDPVAPMESEHLLRWTYGREREMISLARRLKHPNASFMTGTFAIDKESFNKVKFDEGIRHYGHEDTLFGKGLLIEGIKVHHIDNPLVHRGLESTTDFIAKSETAVQTLVELVRAGKVTDEVKLYRVYKKLKRYYLQNLFAKRFNNRKDAWLENLKSTKPDLKYFDMYRLGYLCTLMQK